jgi:membrane-associated protease RseP (regulator of RpoE activity)
MAKIASGVFGLIVAVVALLYGLGVEAATRNSYNPDPFLIEKIPVFLGIELPRGLFLLVTLVWCGSAVRLIFGGLSDIVAVSDFAKELKTGRSPDELLADKVAAHPWAGEAQRLAAQAILDRQPYRAAVRDITARTGEELHLVVLIYKLVADEVGSFSELIRQSCIKAGVSPASLPDVSMHGVVVQSSPGLFSALKQGDVIAVYDGKLVETVEELQAMEAAAAGRKSVPISVLRYTQVTHHNPLFFDNERRWMVHQLELKGGRIGAELSDPVKPPVDTGREPAVSGPTVATANEAAAGRSAPGVPIRFRCPSCGKSLKCGPEWVGRTVVCPAPPRSNGCGLRFRVSEVGASPAAGTSA